MFSFLQKRQKEEQVHLVCLVTGYAVSAAVVKVFTKPGAINRPIVLYSTEVVVRSSWTTSFTITYQEVQRALKHAISSCKKVVPHYDELRCVVGEPWIMTTTRTAHLEKREEFTITKKLIDDLVNRETKLFEQEMARELSSMNEFGLLEVGTPLIDLNGYRIDSDYYVHNANVTARVVDVHCAYTIAPVALVESLVEVYVDMFHRTDVVFHSFDHAKLKLLDNYDHGVICELGGTTVPCMIVQYKTPTHFAAIPTGLHTFEHALADSFGIPHAKIPNIFAFTRDENILKHERDVYHQRILGAYSIFAAALPFHVAHIKKYVHEFREPVVVIGRPEWLGHLRELLANDIHRSVVIPSQEVLSDSFVLAHQAQVVNIPLTLAIIHSLHYEAK